MKRVEEICDRFYKTEKDVEDDLMHVMRQKVLRIEPPSHVKGDYFYCLLNLLIRMGCLEDTGWVSEVSVKGKEYYERGWILHDYATPEKRTRWKIAREWITLAIAIIGLIIAILGLIFPRQKSIQVPAEFFELKTMIPNTTIDLVPQVFEINQESDDVTKKENNENNENK